MNYEKLLPFFMTYYDNFWHTSACQRHCDPQCDRIWSQRPSRKMPCLMDFRCIKSSPGLYPRRWFVVWQPSVYRVEGYPWVLNTRATEKFSTVDGVQLRRGAVLGGGSSVNAGLYRYIYICQHHQPHHSHIRTTCMHFESDWDTWLEFDRLRMRLDPIWDETRKFQERISTLRKVGQEMLNWDLRRWRFQGYVDFQRRYHIVLIMRMTLGDCSRAAPDFIADTGWDTAEVELAYEWVERVVAHEPEVKQWQSAWRDALLEAGVGPYNNYTNSHVIGTKVTSSFNDPWAKNINFGKNNAWNWREAGYTWLGVIGFPFPCFSSRLRSSIATAHGIRLLIFYGTV